MKRLAVLVISLLMLVGCGDDEERLKVRRDIANLQEKLYELERNQTEIKGEIREAVRDIQSQLQDRSNQADTQEQIRSLRETLSQFEARLEDLDSKIADVNRARTQVATAPVQPAEGEGELAPIESVSGKVVEQQFNKAYLDYNSGKLDVAIQGFQGVLENFPQSPYTEACHYYLGRCYHESKQYQKAVEQFRIITTNFAKGDFIKQALYYEGQCYFFLNQHSRSVLAMQDLINRFPGTQEAELAKQFLRKAGYEK